MSKESTPGSDPEVSLTLIKKRHEKFFLRLLDILPEGRFASGETSRMTLLFFTLSGLDVLGCLQNSLNDQRRQEIIEWVYSVQRQHGFLGTTFLISNTTKPDDLNSSVHIAMTYTALAILVILGDDLSRVNTNGLLEGLAKLQKPDGSFMASLEEQHCDMRFVYCAACICTFLNNFGTIDKTAMKNFILKSFSYEGAFGQGPDLEAHGGSTYCAVAALSMLGELTNLDSNIKEKCLKWLSFRLDSGFQGRPNKQDDTCYTWWVGGALKLLVNDTSSEINKNNFVMEQIQHCVPYVLSTQDPITGGLAKWPDLTPDPLHSYLGLSGLGLGNYPELRPVDAELNITLRARQYLNQLHNNKKSCI